MNDSAVGPAAGFIFQFQKALVMLADLQNTKEYISVEKVDDAAAHKEDSTVIATTQAKHTISSSGTTFGDTSYALWRTFEIWISKLEGKTFTDQTVFYCTTNSKISPDALLRRFKDAPTFEEAKAIVETLCATLQSKLENRKKKDSSLGKSMSQIIALIQYALSKEAELKLLWQKLAIEDEADFKEAFLNKVHAFSQGTSQSQLDSIYEEFYGWIVNASLAKWKNAAEATFTKESFNNKFQLIRNSPSIVNAIFRTKSSLGEVDYKEVQEKQKELFVRQIEDMDWRKDIKERKVKTAILEFIYHDIELKYVIDKGDYTQPDFDVFLKECESAWQQIFDACYALELESYTPAQRNEIARRVYDRIMNDIKLEFKDGYCFTTGNTYMRNGCFLKLSNIPSIGWHPEWETKYK